MLRIMVVEDEELVRRGIVLAVDWAAMDCLVVGEAQNGQQGYELICKLSPDIVITDVRMPVMNGIEMIRKLIRETDCSSKFIILTAYSDFAYAHQALKLGVADYLLKPFVDSQLEDAVSRVRLEIEKSYNDTAASNPIFRFNIEKGGKSKYVEMAIVYIREHFAKPDICVGMVAEHLGISEGYLSRVFRKETAYTFVNYLTNYRIHMAMCMLRDPRVKVYEVSDMVGYQDATYFSTLFKRLTGIGPSEYQDRCN